MFLSVIIFFFAVHERAGRAHHHGTGNGRDRRVDDFPDFVGPGGEAY